MTRRYVACLGLGLALALTACGSGDGDGGGGAAPGATAPAVEGDLVVFAAASLTETFTALGEQLEADNPGVTVTFNFAASSALAQQVLSGAPADVFAAASPATMAQVLDGGGADGEPTVFVRNLLQIAVPVGNPGEVTGLADFADEDLAIALCSPEVPCGSAADKALAAAGVTARPDTLEQDVRAALAKVELGEVDAALVYRTDVLAAGDTVEGLDFPEAEEAVNDYPLVALAEAPNAAAAAAFIDLVLSEQGRKVLTGAGFEAPAT